MSDPTSTRASRVLVVDEDPACRLVVQELLRDDGYVTIMCERTVDAPAAAKCQCADIIVFDLVIGREDTDFRTLERLTKDPATAGIPVIATSTNAGLLEEYAETFQRRQHQMILKPYHLDELLDSIKATDRSTISSGTQSKP
jgi:DNA-binding response OmpR family regulator